MGGGTSGSQGLGVPARCLGYAQSMHGAQLAHVQALLVELPSSFVVLDEVTRRNLELT